MNAPPPYSLNVVNGPLTIGSITILGVSSSSSLLLGDTESIRLYAFFDTPPESVIVGQIAPLPELPEGDIE
ncbi:spore gernimation protein GerPD [Cohnella yongneupensis]|uniref:Spore gernimation protein GerPD n=1 Tax=Cohnella yongneupensis TaxID=425006 RepID=A0ABW0R2N7_9BACL